MVTSIRELVNIQTFTSALNSKPSQIARTLANVTIDINSDSIRERSNSSNKTSSRNTLVTSNASSVLYHERMEINNKFWDEKVENPANSFQLSYKDNDRAGNSVRKVTNLGSIRNQQCIQSKGIALKNISTIWERDTPLNNTNMC